jgi:glycosyltransferase involved in cell wall biosynthesis
MVIAVDVRSWNKEQLDGLETCIKQLVLRMVEEQAEHRFFFVSDEPLNLDTALPSNVTTSVLGPASRQLLLQKYWLDVRLPLWLRKIKADVLISLDGMASLTTRVSQCLVVPDLRYLQEPNTYSKVQRAFYKRLMPRFLKKASRIIVPSAFLRNELAMHYKVEADKTCQLAYAVPGWFCPISYEKKESIKALFTQGQEYFLYKGPIHEEYNLVNLLKAFSFFKKRQQSSWKLVLAGTFKQGKNTFQQLLETYKYKDDIVVTGSLSPKEEAEIVAAAYALVSPARSEVVDAAVWEAMQCEIPAMVATTATNKELFGEGVLFFRGDDSADMAEWIMHLYRHESERTVFIERGKEVVQALSWEQATATLWACVMQAANG